MKTLNLKKTFSFLQNLDYNEDDNPMDKSRQLVLPRQIPDELLLRNRSFLIQEQERESDDEEEKNTQRMIEHMDLSISSLNNIQLFDKEEEKKPSQRKQLKKLEKASSGKSQTSK